MATLGEVVDFVLENVGKSDVGDPRALIRADAIDLFTVDLPAEVSGYLSQGLAELSVGYTGSAPEDGVYDIPLTMRTLKRLVRLVDDASLGTVQSQVPPEHVSTDPEDFYYENRWGNADAENPYGRPTKFLVYANQIHMRPIPKQTGSPAWFGKLVLQGSVVQDFSGATDATVIEQVRLVPIVKAGATVLHALRERRADVAQTWGEIYNARKSEARKMMSSFASNQAIVRDF